MVTNAKYLVPVWYSAVSLTVGLLIAAFAIFGFLGVCRKNKKCWLTLFALFTLFVFLMSLTTAVLVFKSDEAISAAESQNFVDISGWEETASNTLKTAVDDLWDKCDGEVTAVAPDMFTLECEDEHLEWAEDIVNDYCLDEPVNCAAGSDYNECYNSEWWSPTVISNATLVTINTDKGIFCQCSEELVKWYTSYLAIGKWVALGVCVYFFLTLLAILYLCCCAKNLFQKEEELTMKGAFFARP